MVLKKNLIFTGLVLVICTICYAVILTGQRETLTNIEGVYVPLIHIDETVAQTYHLNVDIIQTALELQLRRNNITVLDKMPYPSQFLNLYLNVFPSQHTENQMKVGGARSELGFVQRVVLTREPYNEIWATTWERGMLGLVTPQNAQKEVLRCLEIITNEFCNDYLAVNPKKLSTQEEKGRRLSEVLSQLKEADSNEP